MDADKPDMPPNFIEPPPDTLQVKSGDSATTRKTKQLLNQLSWEQKMSLAAFVLLILTIPLTMVAVYDPTRLFPQAKPPVPSPELPKITLTPSPTPTPPIMLQTTIMPAP